MMIGTAGHGNSVTRKRKSRVSMRASVRVHVATSACVSVCEVLVCMCVCELTASCVKAHKQIVVLQLCWH